MRGGVGHATKKVGYLGKRFRTTGGTGSELEWERTLAGYPTTSSATTTSTTTTSTTVTGTTTTTAVIPTTTTAAPPSTSYDNPGGKGNRTALIAVIRTVEGHGYPVELVDGSFGQFGWFNSAENTGKYFQFDFGEGASKIIDEAKWYQSNSATHGSWKFIGSNNGSDWADVGSEFTLGGSEVQTITGPNGNTTGYRYYQMIGVGGVTSGSPNWEEIEFKICDA